ncbi:unnamed protein product [Adineta steineri]|uniref:Methyltransferase FkbM domain-containing protein n=1 Tax=Adineta steineri TaxID=433720 RepID=A0A814WCD3_9BILA|nr:unnamed protein product [Adineta steineri]CAF3976438.1 unnamed protein product [Adineta steineri]
MIVIIACIAFSAFYIIFPTYCGSELFRKTFQNRTKVFDGFGGGVVVVDGNTKQFVTMVQKPMFILNAQGYIPMEDTIKRVWIDVGSHSDSFAGGDHIYSSVYWPHRTMKSLRDEFNESSDLMAIAIDPNARFHESLSKIPRLIPIIAAIYTIEGTQLFYEYALDGCSSLLEPNAKLDPNYYVDNWQIGCHQVKRMTGVSTIPLEKILSIIHPRLDIQLLKIDAQGVDLDVVKSCGKQLQRVEKIIIEIQKVVANNKTNNLLYKNQITADESVLWMKENGFFFNKQQASVNNKQLEEYNYVFDNGHFKRKKL